jgi:ATP-dependent helicase HrpA
MMLDPRQLARRLTECTLLDQRRLGGRLRGAKSPEALAQVAADIERAVARRERRFQNIRSIHFPPDLPVSERKEDIAEAIRHHQVIVLCGETGSGKTTQLPKICLELGRGSAGLIGHTQPRRIAARTVAARIAEELNVPLGREVGYKIRFGDKTGPETLIKVMTDGILLAETQNDRLLEQYDTIIIDEAHERSLNIDFLLGYFKHLLPRRPDLKLIVTSATIDPERFAEHFSKQARRHNGSGARGDDAQTNAEFGERREEAEKGTQEMGTTGVVAAPTAHSAASSTPTPAPIIMVSGRTYPVEILYRPPSGYTSEDGEFEGDQVSAILRAVDECTTLGRGDILVFLSGEREIRETAEELRRSLREPGTIILPLFSRLSNEEQNRVFQPHSGRRIVLATNVAETSLTVPGIRYVIDTGEARINRYSPRTKVQRLEIEAISRASADQRKGRCGRVGPGVCIRLYSEEDYTNRSAFTDPEIVRTNLASVILQMKALGLGRVESFPFVEPPDSRMIKDGYDTLRELGAVDEKGDLTEIGRRLSKLPIDPRIGRMILAADAEGSLAEVLVIAAALSVQDPRDRRQDHQDAADAAHATFKSQDSDFLFYLNLWRWYHEQQEKLSRSRLVKVVKDHYLSYFRMREWVEVHRQLRDLITEMGIGTGRASANTPSQREGAGGRVGSSSDHRARPQPIVRPPQRPATYDQIHRALLTGMLSGLGRKGDQGEYSGTHNSKFFIHPGSGLSKSKPKWVMAAELVRTTKLYARACAKIDPQWIEAAAAHLVSRTHSEPHWDSETERVLAYEKVLLYGLEIVAGRRVHYGPINPDQSREIFIHAALVDGDYRTDARWFRHNRALQDEVEMIEIKTRRRDLLVDAQARFEFYHKRLPRDVYSGNTFERWRAAAERENRSILMMTREDLMLHDAAEATLAMFPDTLLVGDNASAGPATSATNPSGTRLKIEYTHEPGTTHDGITLHVPVEALNQLEEERCDWLVPGLVKEKIAEMIRAVPKSQRRHLGPPNQMADEVLAGLTFGVGPFDEQVRLRLEHLTGVEMPKDVWAQVHIPEHLKMNFRVLNNMGEPIAEGRDLRALKDKLGVAVRQSFAKLGGDQFHRDAITKWDFGDLPDRVEVRRGTMTVVGYPALVDLGKDAGLRVAETPARAAMMHRAGVRRLFLIKAGREIKYQLALRTRLEKLCVQWSVLGSANDLKADLMGLVAERAFLGEASPLATPIRTQKDFEQKLERGYDRITPAVDEVGTLAEAILDEFQNVRLVLESQTAPAFAQAHQDVRHQMSGLVYKGFMVATPREWLPHVPRFLAAIRTRLNKLPRGGLDRDARLLQPVLQHWHACLQRLDKHKAAGILDPELILYRWMIEEFRVSQFAQELRTSIPVSERRLEEQWERIGRP